MASKVPSPLPTSTTAPLRQVVRIRDRRASVESRSLPPGTQRWLGVRVEELMNAFRGLAQTPSSLCTLCNIRPYATIALFAVEHGQAYHHVATVSICPTGVRIERALRFGKDPYVSARARSAE